jgi:hypothetical protein
MVLLSDPPAVQVFPGRIEQTRAASEPYRQHLRDVQQALRPQIEAMSVKVIGSIQHLLNGIFVNATPTQAAALRNLPGVAAVLPMRRFHLNDQLTLSDVQQAWSSAHASRRLSQVRLVHRGDHYRIRLRLHHQ